MKKDTGYLPWSSTGVLSVFFDCDLSSHARGHGFEPHRFQSGGKPDFPCKIGLLAIFSFLGTGARRVYSLSRSSSSSEKEDSSVAADCIVQKECSF